MKKLTDLLREIDLHVVAMLLVVVPLVLLMPLFPWSLLVVALLPQGRILVRALVDYPAFKQPARSYLVANEAFVVLLVAACWAAWHWLRTA